MHNTACWLWYPSDSSLAGWKAVPGKRSADGSLLSLPCYSADTRRRLSRHFPCCIEPSSLGLGVFLEGGLSLPTFYSPLVYHYYYTSTVALLAVHFFDRNRITSTWEVTLCTSSLPTGGLSQYPRSTVYSFSKLSTRQAARRWHMFISDWMEKILKSLEYLLMNSSLSFELDDICICHP
jgi:hypothetical protein